MEVEEILEHLKPNGWKFVLPAVLIFIFLFSFIFLYVTVPDRSGMRTCQFVDLVLEESDLYLRNRSLNGTDPKIISRLSYVRGKLIELQSEFAKEFETIQSLRSVAVIKTLFLKSLGVDIKPCGYGYPPLSEEEKCYNTISKKQLICIANLYYNASRIACERASNQTECDIDISGYEKMVGSYRAPTLLDMGFGILILFIEGYLISCFVIWLHQKYNEEIRRMLMTWKMFYVFIFGFLLPFLLLTMGLAGLLPLLISIPLFLSMIIVNFIVISIDHFLHLNLWNNNVLFIILTLINSYISISIVYLVRDKLKERKILKKVKFRERLFKIR